MFDSIKFFQDAGWQYKEDILSWYHKQKGHDQQSFHFFIWVKSPETGNHMRYEVMVVVDDGHHDMALISYEEPNMPEEADGSEAMPIMVYNGRLHSKEHTEQVLLGLDLLNPVTTPI